MRVRYYESLLDKVLELKDDYAKQLITLRDLRRYLQYFDYEVEEKILEVLEELESYITDYTKDNWVKISNNSNLDGLHGLYFITLQYNRSPLKYNHVELARYDYNYHTFVHSSNGRSFSKDIEMITYMPYSNEFNPHRYMNEEEVFKDNDYNITGSHQYL